MKKIVIVFCLLIFASSQITANEASDVRDNQTTEEDVKEKELLKNEVVQFYIRGLQIRDFSLIRAICISDAKLYGVRRDSSLGVTTLDQWSKRFDPDNPPFKSLDYKIEKIDIAGTAAQVKILFIMNKNRNIYDFINMLKVNGKWKIVNIIDY